MANAFDRFDAPAQRTPEQSSGNPFDAFDNAPVAEQPEAPAPRQGLSTSRMLGVGPSRDAEYLQDRSEPAVSDDPGLLSNSIRNAGERGFDLLGNAIQFVGNMAEKGEEAITERLGGLNPGVRVNRSDTLREQGHEPDLEIGGYGVDFTTRLDPKETDTGLTAAGQAVEDVNLGYEKKYTIDRALDEPTLKNLVGAVAEQGPAALADMAALIVSAPSYLASRTQEIGEARVENDGGDIRNASPELQKAIVDNFWDNKPIPEELKAEAEYLAENGGMPELKEYLVAGPTAAASVLLDRFALGKLLPGGGKAITSARQIPGAIGRATVTEATTEAMQEGGIEYAGESIGTREGWDSTQAWRRAAGGALVGGPTGGAVRGGTAGYELATSQRQPQGLNRESVGEGVRMDAEPGQEGIDVTPGQTYGNNPFDQFDQPVQGLETAGATEQAPAETPVVTESAPTPEAETAEPETPATEETGQAADDLTPFERNQLRDAGVTDQQLWNMPTNEARARLQTLNRQSSQPEPQDITESGTGVFRVPVDQIQVDPEQYQFRSRVNDQGVDERLSGVDQWDDNRAGTVLLHRREDGSLYVADGHHRVDLARRLGQGEINARIVDEADGVDVPTARVEAAMNNIADGKAEPLDVAKVFRDSGTPSSEVRSAFNLPNSQVVRDGEALANLSDNVFGMVSAGQMAEKDGAAIGAAFTEPSQQEAAADAFTKVQPETEYQRQLLVNEIRAAEFAEAQGEQGGLFGDDPQEVSLMHDRLKVLDALRQRLNSDKRLFKSLNDNADRAGEVGNQIATEANESITKQSARSLDLISRVTTTPALNEMVNRAARRVYDGENRSQVVKDLKQELMAYEAGTATESRERPATAPSRRADEGAGQEQRADQRVPAQDTAGEDQGAQPESGQQEEVAPEPAGPTLELETQTEEQLAEQERTRQEAEQAEAQARREEEQRADADDQVDSFTLTGSDRTADVAMAAGQDDMFVSTPASRGSAGEVTGEVAGEAGSTTDQQTEPADTAPSQEAETESGQADQETEQPAQPIEDFGEKIEGARKDYASKLQDAKERDVSAVPLSKSWPEPNYQKMLDEGVPAETVALVRALRDEVPTKPQKGWKLKGWVEMVTGLRDMASTLMENQDVASQVVEQIRAMKASNRTAREAKHILGRMDLYQELGHENSFKGVTFEESFYQMYMGENNVTIWEVERLSKATAFGNMPRTLATGKTREEALDNLRKALDQIPESTKAGKAVRFNIYRDRYSNEVFIGKKIGKNVVRLKVFDDDVKAARKYLEENQQALEAQLEKMKQIPDHRRKSNSPRVGVDHRKGGDVTPEAFVETFGFRGVQFGNYVEQGRRQADLNETYDALMDLAGILDIPAKAISLNGELGLAFGARGKGGKNAHAAHYESGQIVINLTKKSGAGRLAHEWWHTLDNYFGRGTDRKPRDAFASGGQPASDVRPEMADAFRNIRQTVNRIRMKERSKALDKVRTKAYWSTDIEMSARAFESYVVERLKDQNASNDYLANIVSEDYWKASEALGMQESDSYPYPEAAEVPEIRAAYDHFFQTIEAVEQPDGNVLLREDGSAYDGEQSVDDNQQPAQDGIEARRSSYRANPNQGDLFTDMDALAQLEQVDAYDNLETRPGTTEAQREAGRSALQDLFRQLNARYRRTGRLSEDGPGISLLGAAIYKDFKEGKPNQLIGQTVRTPHDLAALAQVYRDPRFETFRFILTKDGAVVGEQAITSRLPAAVALGSDFTSELKTAMESYGADGYYMLHNHPSGVSDPSQADLATTRKVAREVEGFQSHVVINFNQFDAIDAEGNTVKTRDDNLGSLDLWSNPEKPNDFLGFKVTSPEHVVGIAKHLQNSPDRVVYVGTTARGKVALLTSLPSRLVTNLSANRLRRREALATLRRLQRASGTGGYSFLVTSNSTDAVAMSKLIDQGVVRDIVTPDGYSAQNDRVGNWRGGAVESVQAKSLRVGEDSTDYNIPTLDADPFGLPSDTIVRRAVSKIADKFTVLKGVQEQIKKTEGQIPEQADAYMAEELFHGKVENDIRLIRERMIEPLTERMAEYGVTLKQLDEFLYAMHAPERNRVIAERNPEMPDGGSGMTNAEAAKVIEKVDRTGKLGQYKELAGRVHRMLEMRRDILRDAGLLDEDTLGAWEASYRAYVPLKGFAADEAPDGRPRIGKGFAIAGKESQLAGGRRSRAASPVANSISDLSEAVLRHRKNEVGQAFMNLVQMYPNDSYWRIYSDENPEVERKPVRVKDPETGKMKVEVREQTVPMAMMSDRYFTTKVGGKTYYIKIEDQRLMNAMRNIGPDNNNILVRSLAAVTRVMSSLNTSYNPEFVISNFSRDIQTALLNLTSEQSSEDGKARGKKIAAKTLKDTGTAIRAINASLKGRELTGKAGRWQKHFDQFRADGAKTGWFDMKDVDGQMRDMEKLVKLAQGGAISNLRKTFRAVTDWVEHTNGAIENGVRLSAYVNAIEAGIPRAQAASLAKNMTVNFNRRGEWGTTMNAVYMFANASVQGTNNFIRTLGRLNGHKGDRIWRRMNTAQKIAAGMAVGGFMLSLLNRLGAGEDEDEVNWWDKVPDYIKERNIVVMKSLVGGEPGEYWTIPLPYGYNIFPVMGTQLEHLAFSENQSAGQAASNTILAALGSFSPIGFEESQEAYGTVIKNVTPTILRPIASISLNENFMGGPIFKENFPFGTPKPDSSLYFRSTPEMFKLLAKEINEATGGNEQMSGAADWSPDVMNYLVAYYGGGAYDFFTSRTPNFVTKALTGVELEDREVPFWRKIHGKVLPYEDQSIFYDRRDEINQLVERREALKPRERGPFVREYRDKLRLKPIMDSTEKRLRRLREQRDRIEMRDDLSMAEKDQRLQDVEARIKREIDRFNQRYNEADD